MEFFKLVMGILVRYAAKVVPKIIESSISFFTGKRVNEVVSKLLFLL